MIWKRNEAFAGHDLTRQQQRHPKVPLLRLKVAALCADSHGKAHSKLKTTPRERLPARPLSIQVARSTPTALQEGLQLTNNALAERQYAQNKDDTNNHRDP